MNSKERDPFLQVKTCARKIWVPPEKMTLFRAKDCQKYMGSKNKWNLHLLRPDIAAKKVGVFEKKHAMGPTKKETHAFFGQNTMPKKVPVHKNYECTKTHILAKTLPKRT